jgi:cytidylate kinase
MKKNEPFVITINRELGSGGRTVGEKLAQRIGVSFYDKAIIRGLEEKYGLTAEEIEKLKGKKRSWWMDFQDFVTSAPYGGANARLWLQAEKLNSKPTSGELFHAESEILEAAAQAGSCVVTGRCGFFVFRNHPNHLSVLIKATKDYRVDRVMKRQGLSRNEALSLIARIDNMRENYVQNFTGLSRYDSRNYQLVLSMDEITEDEAVDIILKFLK